MQRVHVQPEPRSGRKWQWVKAAAAGRGTVQSENLDFCGRNHRIIWGKRGRFSKKGGRFQKKGGELIKNEIGTFDLV